MRAALSAALLVVLGVVGCATRGITPREFVLNAEATPALGSAPRDLRIGVGPFKVPGYLDRPQLVTRLGPNELHFSEVERWGEPLRTGLVRVVADNLTVLVPSGEVTSSPRPDGVELDYRVVVEVDRFEPGPDGALALEARWLLLSGEGGATLAARRSAIRGETAAGDAAHAVQAMSRGVAQLSEEIAAEIRRQAGFAEAATGGP